MNFPAIFSHVTLLSKLKNRKILILSDFQLNLSISGTTPIVADAVSLNCNQKSKTANSSFSSNELQRHKPLSGLLADHDLESDIGTGSVSVSSVTSPISQSSYNPLLDELVHQASDDSAYMVMSPATSSGK